ncbi:MAG: thiamine diphosphokinase [Chloroflexi bacterium]|nr:thiamine diphosphokinase [Chloroflexota bacterium]
MRSIRTVIFANGELQDLDAARAVVQPTDTIIAADGGAKHCLALGVLPHILIGDFDSLAPTDLTALEAAGTRIIRHPARKDQTDLELALDFALTGGADDIIVLGALGGRWDQTLANLLLLAWPALSSTRIRLLDGTQEISLLRGPGELTFAGTAGDTISLIPVGGDASGITTSGLEYPLSGETLNFGSTRGISNVMIEPQVTVALTKGLLICVTIRVNGFT